MGAGSDSDEALAGVFDEQVQRWAQGVGKAVRYDIAAPGWLHGVER